MAPGIALGPAAVATLGRATAFPARAEDTATLLARLAPELPAARRAALEAHVEADVGVRTRAFVTPPQRALDLAIVAARDALAAARVGARNVCMHVHATSTPSRWTGPEAARIGQALGLGAAFMDVRSGCTGGLWALVEGARLAVAAQAPVLVTAADAFSLTFDHAERMLPLALGDGAAALVLAPTCEPDVGLVRASFAGAPEHADLATVPAELPPLPGARWSLAGDAVAFSEVAERALGERLAAIAPPPEARVVVLTSRAALARRVTRTPWLDALARHGHLGAAMGLVALAELPPGTTVLASAGGGLSAGALVWRDAV